MIELKEKILNHTFKIYSLNGFRKTTMDEIADELGMSKKTIYKFFPSKTNLIEAVVNRIMESMKTGVAQSLTEGTDCVYKLHKLSLFIAERVSEINMKWIADLQIHAPFIWNKVEKFRKKIIMDNMINVIIDGQKKGFIVEAPIEIIMTIIISSLTGVVNPEFLINNNISAKNAVQNTLDIVFGGILTKEGRKIYKQYSVK